MSEFKKIGRDIYLKLGSVQGGVLYDTRHRRIGVQHKDEFFLENNRRTPFLILDEKDAVRDERGKLFIDQRELSKAFESTFRRDEILPLAAFLRLNRK